MAVVVWDESAWREVYPQFSEGQPWYCSSAQLSGLWQIATTLMAYSPSFADAGFVAERSGSMGSNPLRSSAFSFASALASACLLWAKMRPFLNSLHSPHVLAM